jgi:DNA-binding LacI/PurR family transcriptional regulator
MLYKQVHETLRDEIRAGEHPVGERLPGEAELIERFAVSSITLRRALDLLKTEGYVTRRPRVGTTVVSADPGPAPAATVDAGHRLVGFVVTNFDDTFGSRVVEGLLDHSDAALHVALERSQGDPDREDELIRSLVDGGAHGLVVLPGSSEYIPPAVLELVTQRFPVVIIDRSYDGVPLSAVVSDNPGGAKAATEHLFELGHRRIGFVSSASHVTTSDDRRDGFVQAHAERRIPLDPARELRTLGSTTPGSTTPLEDDIAALEGLLRERDGTTAYLVSEYNLALLLREAARRLGLDVPGDVSIACFDHPALAFDPSAFRFTHVRQDQHGMGRAAIEQLEQQLRDRSAVRRTVLPTELVLGDSTAAPRA